MTSQLKMSVVTLWSPKVGHPKQVTVSRSPEVGQRVVYTVSRSTDPRKSRSTGGLQVNLGFSHRKQVVFFVGAQTRTHANAKTRTCLSRKHYFFLYFSIKLTHKLLKNTQFQKAQCVTEMHTRNFFLCFLSNIPRGGPPGKQVKQGCTVGTILLQ